MSIRVQARLLDKKMTSHVEEAQLRRTDTVVLKNVKAEMVVDATDGFMEHESQLHKHLPYFHIVGKIKEIRGNFPYNVSSLFFSDSDNRELTKDFLYYPSPDELIHLITKGHYYTDRFTLPKVLTGNEYTFPCNIDLTIIPPPNPAAYERNMSLNFDDLEDEDKLNLPIVYVGILGTGVSRKNDRTLKYYGIEFEPGYANFVLTAESSGYTDPPLLAYIEEVELTDMPEDVREDDYYLGSQDDFLQSRSDYYKAAEKAAEAQVALGNQAENYRAATKEDMVVARADRRIARRMEDRFARADGRLSLSVGEAVKGSDGYQDTGFGTDTDGFIDYDARSRHNGGGVVFGPSGGRLNFSGRDVPQQQADIKMDFDVDSNGFINMDRDEAKEHPSDARRAEDIMKGDIQANSKLQGSDVADARAQTKIDEAKAKTDALDAARQQQAEVSGVDMDRRTDREPDTRQQQAEVKMDLNPDMNTDVKGRPDEDKRKDVSGKDVMKIDKADVSQMSGADVADASAQAKVDEAHGADVTDKHRKVSQQLSDIANKYDELHGSASDQQYDQ